MYRQYPEMLNDDHTFYVVFSEDTERNRIYSLLQRSYILDKDEFEQDRIKNPWLTNEGHPYTMERGRMDREGLISSKTERFLKFTVDALNNQYKLENP